MPRSRVLVGRVQCDGGVIALNEWDGVVRVEGDRRCRCRGIDGEGMRGVEYPGLDGNFDVDVSTVSKVYAQRCGQDELSTIGYGHPESLGGIALAEGFGGG